MSHSGLDLSVIPGLTRNLFTTVAGGAVGWTFGYENALFCCRRYKIMDLRQQGEGNLSCICVLDYARA